MDNWDTANMQLLAELKMIFPEISEEKIHDCIIQNSKDKETCIKVLTRMNEDYLFGCQSPISALSISDKFNKLCHNDETAENNESKETCESELDIFIPEETLNFRFLLNEEKKSLNLKDCNQPILQETNNTDKGIGNQYPQRKSTVHSAPVISSASHPFGLMDNGNVLPASIQSELPSNIDISHLLSQNDALSKDILKWNNNHNEFFAQLQTSAQFSRQNFSRGYSYPIPDPLSLRLQNIPSLSQSSLYHFNNHLQAKDYSTPLYVAVTSPQFLPPSYITSHPPVGLLPSSPNVQRRNSPISSHLTACYNSPLSTVLPSSSLSSSVPHVPSFSYPSPICPPHQQQTSTGNSSHSPTPPNLHYIYEHNVTEDQLRERIGVKKNAQCTTTFPQAYELFPKQDFMPSTYSPNLPTSLDDYSSQFTHQMPSFLPTPSHSRPNKNNEMDYIKALLPYQTNSYKLIVNELMKMTTLRYTLRMDVSSREQELSQIRQQQQFPNMEQIQKLKEEIIKLRVERDCLAMELDFHVKGQESTNTIEENFYEHIFTGPTGSICPAPNNERVSAQNSNSNHRDEDDQGNKWNCSKCTYANHPDLRDCEICESPRVMIMPN